MRGVCVRIHHRRTGWKGMHSMPHTVHIRTKILDFAPEVIILLFELINKIDCFAKDLPLAGLHGPIGRELVAELIKEIFHFFSPFPLSKFV